MGAYLEFVILRKIGRRIKHEINVFDRLIKRSIPIDDVPWWVERYNVLKEKVVVRPLNKIAIGVLDSKIFLTSLNSWYLSGF